MPLGAFKAALMGTAGVDAGADVVLLSTQTASNSATISFTSDITSTYPMYIFRFYNVHPVSHANFTFNGSIDSGSNYNVTKTTTVISAYHAEDGSAANVYYVTTDLAQSTAFHPVAGAVYTANDASMVGELHLFNPSSTTYVKNFTTNTQRMDWSDDKLYTNEYLTSGYFNTTSPIDAVQFKMASGNFDGKIKMWGVK